MSDETKKAAGEEQSQVPIKAIDKRLKEPVQFLGSRLVPVVALFPKADAPTEPAKQQNQQQNSPPPPPEETNSGSQKSE